MICSNVKCFENEDILLLIIVSCGRNDPNEHMPGSSYSCAYAKVAVHGGCLIDVLMFSQIRPLFRLQIVFKVLFHSLPVENDFRAPQS